MFVISILVELFICLMYVSEELKFYTNLTKLQTICFKLRPHLRVSDAGSGSSRIECQPNGGRCLCSAVFLWHHFATTSLWQVLILKNMRFRKLFLKDMHVSWTAPIEKCTFCAGWYFWKEHNILNLSHPAYCSKRSQREMTVSCMSCVISSAGMLNLACTIIISRNA